MKERLLNAFRNWNPEVELAVKVKFIHKGTETPLTGKQYTVRLYDRELFTADDYLGHSQLNERGEATIQFFPADVRAAGWGGDDLPDLYILLFKGNTVHFQSKVWHNIDFDKLGLLDFNEGEVLNFGTFLVD
jgi:hypothetical protein